MPRRPVGLLLALWVWSCGPDGAAGPFVRVALELGPIQSGRDPPRTILEVNGGGVALFDGDGDGDLDLLLVSPGAYPGEGTGPRQGSRLYRNDGAWRFVDVTAGSGVDLAGFCNGVAVGDVDADGLRDLYVTRLGANVLLRNLGGLRFEPVPDAAGAAGAAWSTSALFVDLDRDGDPDLYVANYLAFDPTRPPQHGRDGEVCLWKGMEVLCGPQGLVPSADRYYRNDGGRFVDATSEVGFDVPAGYGLGVLDGDFDGDGWPDVYVTNDSTPNFLFMGSSDGRVRETGMLSGAAVSARGREQAGMGLAAGDVDADEDEDLLVTNFSMEPNALYLHEGGGRFRDVADPSGLGGPSRRLLGWGTALLDVDLDGDLDAVTANGHVYPQADAENTDTSYAQPDMIWRNDGSGRFVTMAWPGEEPELSRALAVGDLDDDGRPDLVVTRLHGAPMLWRGTAPGETLQVVVAGPPGNPDGCGTKLRFTDAQGTRTSRVRTSAGYQAAGDPRPVFAWRGPGQLEFTRPDGSTQTLAVTAPGRLTVPAAGP